MTNQETVSMEGKAICQMSPIVEVVSNLVSKYKTKLGLHEGIRPVEVEDFTAERFEDPLKAITVANEVLDSIHDWQQDHYRLLVSCNETMIQINALDQLHDKLSKKFTLYTEQWVQPSPDPGSTSREELNLGEQLMQSTRLFRTVRQSLSVALRQLAVRCMETVQVIAPQYSQMVFKDCTDCVGGNLPPDQWQDGFGSLFQQQELITDKILTEAILKILYALEDDKMTKD